MFALHPNAGLGRHMLEQALFQGGTPCLISLHLTTCWAAVGANGAQTGAGALCMDGLGSA